MSIIGCDLGTTNSGAAWFDGRSPAMVEMRDPFPDGSPRRLLSSVVTINPEDSLIHVGHDAISFGREHPEYCFRRFKRFIGEHWNPDEDTGYQTCEGPDGMVHFKGPDGHTCSPQELSSYVITELLNAAEEKLGERPERAVICVPADFTEVQRAIVEQAGRDAGLAHVYLLDEPTAAAIAYGVDPKNTKTLAVYDLGGGTFDVSIIRTGKGLIEVLATNGNRKLGGSDFDARLAEYVTALWRSEYETDLAVQDSAMTLIRSESEAAKIRLSRQDETDFRVMDIDRTADGEDLSMDYPIDRRRFDEMTKALRDSTIRVCQRAIEDVRRRDPKFTVRDIDEVILVGGMTRVPAIRDAVKEFFGREPKKDINPEEVVAMGAALHAAVIEGRAKPYTLTDITSHSLAIETNETFEDVARVLIPKGTPYPTKEALGFLLTNKTPDQQRLSIRILQGESPKASECDVLTAADVEIEPGEELEARLPLSVSLDASGRPTIICGGDLLYGVGDGP